MNDTAPTDPVRTPMACWSAQLPGAIARLEHSEPLPAPPPWQVVDQAAEVEALLTLARELGADLNSSPFPFATRFQGIRTRADQALKFHLNEVEEALRHADRTIAALGGAGAPGPISTRGLGATVIYHAPASGGTFEAVRMDHPELPPDHPVRDVLPAAELIGRKPLALGVPGKGWHVAAEAAGLTRRLAAEQKAHADQNRRDVEERFARQAERARVAFEASPAGQRARADAERRRLEERLTALEAAAG
jgi:hypothetical protein